MLELKTEINIQASADKVWGILTDYDKFPDWNPLIKKLEGSVAVGNKITVTIQPPHEKAMTFKPKVLVVEENKELRWIGIVMFTGMFDGEHKFELLANSDGSTTLKHSEKFSGILVPLFKKMLEGNTLTGFQMMNNKLKELAEKSV